MKKILIIHGWSYKLYNSRNITEPWFERTEFINALKSSFDVVVARLPGFCGEPKPKEDSWSTKDYGVWLAKWMNQNQIKPDCIIGYSFGAPVSLYAFLENELNMPIILISPALIRSDSAKSRFAKFFNFLPKFLKNPLLNLYLSLVSPYYKYGTSFLRQSYKRIVRENSLVVLSEVAKTHSVNLIYGDRDTATNYCLVRDAIVKIDNTKVHIINGGGHNIAKTHYNQIFELLSKIIYGTQLVT